jgi:hypothetical protein
MDLDDLGCPTESTCGLIFLIGYGSMNIVNLIDGLPAEAGSRVLVYPPYPAWSTDILRTGKSSFFMGQFLISMVISHSYVTNYQMDPEGMIFEGLSCTAPQPHTAQFPGGLLPAIRDAPKLSEPFSVVRLPKSVFWGETGGISPIFGG